MQSKSLKSLQDIANRMRREAERREREERGRRANLPRREREAAKEPDIAAPPKAQLRAGCFAVEDIVDKGRDGRAIHIGKAYRRKRMVEVLALQGIVSRNEAEALVRYRHHADAVARSPLKDSLDKRPGGSGNGPVVEFLHASRLVNDCEAAAGSLADILRAVVVDDLSLSQWAVTKYGGSVRSRPSGGREWTLEPSKKALGIARMEIKIAAGRVLAELEA